MMNSHNELNAEFSTPTRKNYTPIVITFIVGIALSLAVFAQSRVHESNRIRTDFADSLARTVSTLEHVFETNLLILHSIGRFCAASKENERRGFKEFVGPFLDQIEGIQALEWIPRVLFEDRAAYEEAARQDGLTSFQFTERKVQGEMIPAGERDEYFPVYFVEPLEHNVAALGFDLASNLVRREALYLSRDSGKDITTARVTLVQEATTQFGFLVFSPVYKNGMPVDTVQGRRNGLKGFVLAVFRADDVVAAALVNLHLRDITVELHDMSAPEDERLLCIYRSDTSQDLDIEDADRGQHSRGLRQTVDLEVGGRQWSIECSANSNFTKTRNTWYPVGTLVAGFSLTGLLVAYLLAGLNRAALMSSEITERKRAEEALREREALYRNAIAAADSVVYQKEFAGSSYTHMGAAITDLIGYDVDEVTPDLWFKIVTQVEMHGSAIDKSQSELRRLFKNGELPVWKGDYKCITKNGETRWLNDSSVPIHDKAGNVVGCLGMLQNITDRKLAEERLRLSEERLMSALVASKTGTWRVDLRTGFDTRDASLNQMLGLPAEPSTQPIEDWFTYVHPDDADAMKLAWQRGLESGLYSVEHRLIRCDGQVLWVFDRGRIIRDDEGKLDHAIGAVMDITERKQAEESRAILSRELDHRVKNNLTSVITLAQLTAQSTDSIKDFVKLFTNRITSLARVHETLANKRWQGIELEELVRVAIGPFHAYEQRLKLSGPEILVSARNVQPLALVMHELLSNAARHGSLSTEDGIVEVKWQREAQCVVIDWSEHGGPPIANPQEFGVGLRLVSGFVEKEIGGKLEVDFNAKGFRCVIQLPAPLDASSSGDET